MSRKNKTPLIIVDDNFLETENQQDKKKEKPRNINSRTIDGDRIAVWKTRIHSGKTKSAAFDRAGRRPAGCGIPERLDARKRVGRPGNNRVGNCRLPQMHPV